MGDPLMQILGWMPVINTFCIKKSLQFGAFCSIYWFFFSSPLTAVRAILTMHYHHESKTPIALIQCIFIYTACALSLVTFLFSCFKCMHAVMPTAEDEEPYRIQNDTCIRIFIIICILFALCEIVWGLLGFIRAFVSPGLLRAYNNKTYNPYPSGDTVCDEVRRGRYRRTRTKCRPVSADEKRNREKWDKDHANDTVYYYDSKIFDAAASAIFIAFHLYGFYPLIALRSHVLELPVERIEREEEEEVVEKKPKRKKKEPSSDED